MSLDASGLFQLDVTQRGTGVSRDIGTNLRESSTLGAIRGTAAGGREGRRRAAIEVTKA